MLAAIDGPVTQWQLVDTYQHGEVDEEGLRSAISRYSELGAEPQKAADELIAKTGSGGVTMLMLTRITVRVTILSTWHSKPVESETSRINPI